MPPFPIKNSPDQTAIPRGRIDYDLNAENLLLHTIQTQEAFEELLSKGRLTPDMALAEPAHAAAYGWMYRQMEARLSTSGDGALWLWARSGRRDLLELCQLATPGSVLLTCRVPRERVLLSHFVDWHVALNGFPFVPFLLDESVDAYVDRCERVYEDFEIRMGPTATWVHGLTYWRPDLRAEIEQSWEGILEPRDHGRVDYWQGTVHFLDFDDVVEAVRLNP